MVSGQVSNRIIETVEGDHACGEDPDRKQETQTKADQQTRFLCPPTRQGRGKDAVAVAVGSAKEAHARPASRREWG